MSEGIGRSAPRIVAIAVALSLTGCSRAESAPPTSTQPPSSTTSPVSTTPDATPLPSATLVTLEPVTPTSDRSIVRLTFGTTDGMGPTLSKVLYEDGSLIDVWSRPLAVQSLTPAGLDLVVARLRDSGYFAKSHTIPTKPIASDFSLYTLTLVVDGTPITIHGTNTGDDPESRTVFSLVEGLLDVATWLPASAFRGGDARPHPYLAVRSRVTTETIPLAPTDRTSPERSIERISWPLPTPPEELGDPISVPDQGARSLRCGVIDGTAEASIRASLHPIPVMDGAADLASAWYLTLPGPRLLELTLRPFLPDEQAACDPASMPAPPSRSEATQWTLVDLLMAGAGGLTPAGEQYVVVDVSRVNGGDVAHVSYYRDGTVLFRDPPPPAVAIGARRLSSDGLETLRHALDDSGLLRSSHEFWGAGGTSQFAIESGSINLFATDGDTDPEAEAIVALARHLADPVAWLPRRAWVGDPAAMSTYLPASVQVSIESDEICVSQPKTQPVTGLVWPLSGTISTFGQPHSELPCHRRGALSAADALGLLDALAATGTTPWYSGLVVSYEITTNIPDAAIGFHFWITP